MKRFILSVLFMIIFGLGAYAKDIIPMTPISDNVRTVGIYQVENDVTVYKFPAKEAPILYKIRYNDEEFTPAEIGANNFFALYVTKKDLAYVNVVDIVDGWVEIVYNNLTGATGWIQEDDPYKFMTWINFYTTYGKKYGLKILKGTPAFCKDLKSSPDDMAQNISTINLPKIIRLNLIRGNWALVSIMDLDKTPKTGYVRWRSDDGVRYFYPDIK